MLNICSLFPGYYGGLIRQNSRYEVCLRVWEPDCGYHLYRRTVRVTAKEHASVRILAPVAAKQC